MVTLEKVTSQAKHDLDETRSMLEALAEIFERPFYEVEERLLAKDIKSLDALLDFIYSKEHDL